jgi:flavin reductase (DIM6/NTAB) family NADH-FMN oxidoreductase RutF
MRRMSANVSEQVKQTIGRALGRVPSGVFILTVAADPHPLVMMASWVQQAAFAPPAVSVAIAAGRPAGDAVRQRKTFGLSIVPDADTSLMKRYARGVPPGTDPFAGVATTRTHGGVIVLTDALAYLECRLLQVCTFGGDHDLFVAEVTDGRALRDGQSFAHQRGNGFHY